MISIQVKQLTETSYMLSNSKTNKSLGIVNYKNEKFSLIGRKEQFDSLEDIAKEFDGKIQKSSEEDNNETASVTEYKGFPIKHPEACDFEEKVIKGVTLYTYRSKPGGKKFCCAGYYSSKFKTNYSLVLCPMVKTLIDNEFYGPYTNLIDAKFQTDKLNKGV